MSQAKSRTLPGFTANASLELGERFSHFAPHEETDGAVIRPARIICPNSALGVACQAAGAPFAFFPCFFSDCCILGFATVGLPACAACTCGG
jgi:hypothetical protein